MNFFKSIFSFMFKTAKINDVNLENFIDVDDDCLSRLVSRKKTDICDDFIFIDDNLNLYMENDDSYRARIIENITYRKVYQAMISDFDRIVNTNKDLDWNYAFAPCKEKFKALGISTANRTLQECLVEFNSKIKKD